ncbi:hypothetical protein BDL97_13G015800 [Sphagnum fallax]|nr:hypothetical protein BDL97_13G015800 [Sphagnum fallax]
MVDAMQQDRANSTNFGRMVVLPANFVGRPRHMNQLYQDSMAFVRKFGKPDLFITVMCNPNWPEILHELRRGEETNDRPDLTSKVFNMKLNALFKDLLQNGFLGTAVANIHVDQPRDNSKYDWIVCAELLDKSTHPELYNIVTSRMLHGPCGAFHPSCACMVNGVCSKGYPKTFQPQTKDSIDSYPTYRRRDDDRTFTHPILGFVFDNRSCHINVEVCSSITAVKYLYKYVYKGHDRALAVNYLDGRYVSASEACHRLFAFDLHGMHPNVYRLAIHLPNEQTTYFPEGTTVGEAMMRSNSTTLTGRNNHVSLGTVGHMYFVQPSKGERYYLRVLLTHVVGATCFEDLKTTHWPHTPTTVVHPTFKVACLARGLLQDDAEWDQCLLKAVGVQLPRSLRQLFASLLIFNNVTNPGRLWTSLREVEQLLQAQGGKTLEDFELPIPAQLAAPGDTVVSEERARYNVTRQAQQLVQYLPLLNQHQRSIYNNVIDVVHDPRPVDKTFFVDGLGGVGKTFLYGCLLSKVRSTGDIALSMASSSITALLLEGSCTAHSRFKIPITCLCGSSTCYVTLNSPQAALIRVARLIVWDEAPMAHKHVFEVVNRTLQHVMGALKDILFRGKVVVMGGDFRQLLPVVPRGTRGQIVDATLKRSAILWHNVKGTEQVFLEVGEESILIPEDMCCQGDTIDSLVNEVYGDLGRFTDSAILTPLNEDVDSINTAIMNRFDLSTPDGPQTQRCTYQSVDFVVQGEQRKVYPTEFLNSLSMPGVPPHTLTLQEGCPVILLRNMPGGLANGTLLIVVKLMQHIIDAKITTGPNKGRRIFIPRLNITPSNTERMPITLHRR